MEHQDSSTGCELGEPLAADSISELGRGSDDALSTNMDTEQTTSLRSGNPTKPGMLFAGLWRFVNLLIIVSFALLIFGLFWNHLTHEYLRGFADAIVPLNGSDEKKAEALLGWLSDTPGRAEGFAKNALDERDPVDVLHDEKLLKVCGSTANAFINLAAVAGLESRRLLLVTETGEAKHVTAEVLIGGRWVVVDPTTGSMFKDASGRLLTKEELRDPEVFLDAISRIPRYPAMYSFERTAYFHLERLPLVGRPLRRILNRLLPGWDTALDWGYLPEHPSLWPVLASLVLLGFGIPFRFLLDWYGRKRLQVNRTRFRQRLARASQALFLRST